MFTIEFQPIGAPSYAWTKSRARCEAFGTAADAAAEWLKANHEHGVELNVRVVAIETQAVAEIAEAA